MSNKRRVIPRKKLILASRSPRRRSLLQQMGLVFHTAAADIDEGVLDGEGPDAYAARMAESKARVVGRDNPDAWILGADTVVTIDERILGTPGAKDEAREMLRALSGKRHVVISAYCLFHQKDGVCLVRSVESGVVFKDLREHEIEGYLNSGEPFDKAGGYAVQGLGAFMVREVHGSYTNVVGLPICQVIESMLELGVIDRFP